MPSSHRLQVRTYEGLDSLELLRKDWEDLLAAFPSATIFSTVEWLAPWWRAFGSGQELKIVGFYDSGRLAALAPLSLKNERVPGGLRLNVLRLMGDGSGDSDNLDLPVRPGYETAFAATLLDFLKTGALRWDVCYLNTLPDDSPAGNPLLLELNCRGWTHYSFDQPWLVIDLPSTWEAYVARLSNENQKNLDRYEKRLARRYKVRIYKCAGNGELPECLGELFRLHQRRWELRGEPGTFVSPARQQFYHDLGRELLSRQMLEFWLLSLDGKTAAAQFCFRYRDAVFLLQEGFDPEHASDRVGFLLRGHVLKQLISEGVRRYDFLQGESAGKAIWAPQRREYKNIHFATPLSLGGFYLGTVQEMALTKKWLRKRLPAGTWSALHWLNLRLRDTSARNSSKLENGTGPEEARRRIAVGAMQESNNSVSQGANTPAVNQASIRFYSRPLAVEEHSSYSLFREERELFQRYFRSGDKIADLACGAGRTTLRLYEMGIAPTGLDLSDLLISTAARRFPQLCFTRGSYTAIPFRSDYFDHALISFNGLDYAPRIEDRAAALKECHRIIKPGGKLISSSHNIKALHLSPYYFRSLGMFKFKLRHTLTAFKSAAYLNTIDSVRTFHASPEYVLQEAESAGFRFVEWLGFRNLRDRIKNRYISVWVHYVFEK